MPMFLHPKSWQYIKGGRKSKYGVRGKFYSQTFISAKSGWCSIGWMEGWGHYIGV